MTTTQSSVNGTIFLRGSTPLPGAQRASIMRWEVIVSSQDGNRQFFVDSFKFKLLPGSNDVTQRLEIGGLADALQRISDDVRPELTRQLERFDRAAIRARQRGLEYRPNQPWIEKLPPIHQRLAILRAEHERRKRAGEFAGRDDVMSISEVSSAAGVATDQILEFESQGLLRPTRSEGGQRRYSQDDARLIRELARRGRASSSVASAKTTPKEPQRLSTDRPRLETSDVKAMTVATVAQLYLEACERYPNRDRSVIDYIREHMDWLSDDYIITVIRLARKWGISLPVYRRGRLPKQGSSSVSKDTDI